MQKAKKRAIHKKKAKEQETLGTIDKQMVKRMLKGKKIQTQRKVMKKK